MVSFSIPFHLILKQQWKKILLIPSILVLNCYLIFSFRNKFKRHNYIFSVSVYILPLVISNDSTVLYKSLLINNSNFKKLQLIFNYEIWYIDHYRKEIRPNLKHVNLKKTGAKTFYISKKYNNLIWKSIWKRGNNNFLYLQEI